MLGIGNEPTPPPGSRPKGTRNEREAARRVREMFSRIAPRYDFLNHLLSFSLDRVWRHRTARRFQRILRRTESRVLDLCCGTGDMAFALNSVRVRAIRDRGAHRFPIVGTDFSRPMVERARKKTRGHKYAATFLLADAMQLPFEAETFDLVTSAFGFRNLTNYEAGLREIARVLKPGAQVAILEFSEPRGPMAPIYRLYFRRVLPIIGTAISQSKDAYFYLPGSIAKFPAPQEISSMMRKTGFEEVKAQSWNFGTVVLHSGKRKKEAS
jgi:demethylmenaquinone methyltransferase / 2-methoxy-6-polyprenyl-1,4-benzoquinol methylase